MSNKHIEVRATMRRHSHGHGYHLHAVLDPDHDPGNDPIRAAEQATRDRRDQALRSVLDSTRGNRPA